MPCTTTNSCASGVNAATAAATTAAVHQNRINGYVQQVECSISEAARSEKSFAILPSPVSTYSSQLSYGDKQEVRQALEAKGFKVSGDVVSW